MCNKDISVVVPVFNCGTYLAPLFDSLYEQTGVSLEIIAVNDGSTDNSLAVLEDAARRDSRLVIINQPNQGLSAARNAGIRRATARWIAFADGDDWLAPHTLSTWLQQANQQQLDLLIGNGFTFTTNPDLPPERPLLRKQSWGEILSGQQWIIRSVEHNEWPHYAWLQLIRRELINTYQLAFIPGMLHEDILWTTHLALVTQRIGFCDTPFYGYRTNPQSITHSPSTQALLARANSYLHIIKALVSLSATQEPPLRRALLRHANQESGHFLGLMRKRLPPSPERTALAIKFRELSLPSALFQGAGNIHEFWRALRCSVILARLAQQNHK
ncbi:putative glycosyl transferase [Yersinia aldovae]|uniref:glycosyltransferase n=1 Tax=Yersinia aldovae TaxID=29483 RepID=UPI0005DD5581|nr:glycosyltransferase [Yersinia aldovae]CNJ62631.1 putative glycosyl transferase [Yersinia aldovae]